MILIFSEFLDFFKYFLSCPDYKTSISGDCFDLAVQDVGICGEKCCILLTCFVYMAIYDLFFGALKLFF